jgi:CheY-like chemotaxis protein
MTAPIVGFPESNLPGNSIKNINGRKKRVLLVDTCRVKRDMRAETMRRLGAEVDCAADVSEARGWWKPDLYDLVLLHVEDELVHRDKFCDDVRSAAPQQQIAFLVGKPEYIAGLPNASSTPPSAAEETVSLPQASSVATETSTGVGQRWGILEACRRISAVRSVADARTRALRDRQAPARDLEIAALKRLPGAAQALESKPFAEIDGKETK